MNFFRSIILLLLVVLLSSFFFSWDWTYGDTNSIAKTWLGAGSILNGALATGLGIALFVAYSLAYTGMFFYARWARALLIGVSIVGGVSISLYGISVESGVEAMLGFFATLGDGFVIGLSYFSRHSARFNGRRINE